MAGYGRLACRLLGPTEDPQRCPQGEPATATSMRAGATSYRCLAGDALTGRAALGVRSLTWGVGGGGGRQVGARLAERAKRRFRGVRSKPPDSNVAITM